MTTITLLALAALALVALVYWYFFCRKKEIIPPTETPKPPSPPIIDFNAMSRDTLEFDRQIRAVNPLYT